MHPLSFKEGCISEAHLLTLHEDLRDFGVAGAESTVDLKTVCIVQERASEGEEDFLYKGVTQPVVQRLFRVFKYLLLVLSFAVYFKE